LRLGREKDGTESVEQYLMEKEEWPQETEESRIKQLFPSHIDRKNLVVDRFKILLEENCEIPNATFLLCDVLSDLGRYKDAISELEKLSNGAQASTPEIISWITKNQNAFQTAPAQRLLAILNTNIEKYEEAQKAYSMTSEMDPTLIPELIRYVENHIEQKGENKTLLKTLTGLYTKSNNSEKAEELLQKLKEEHSLNNAETLEMTTEVIKNCGATLANVLSALKISMNNNDISESLPYVIEFYRETPEKHHEFASELRKVAGDNVSNWAFISELLDKMKEETDLSKSFQLLHAHSHLHSGKIEKAVFAYDRLMMFDEDIKLDVIAEYEKVVADNLDNTTLLLALYQLHFDEEQFVLASHFLGKALESDPSQIKDIITRFNKIVDREPSNKEIWGEFLHSTLAINHTSLAQEILSRAVSTLGREEAAALHIYGAKISRENNKIEDSLKCLAMTLTSKNPDLKAIEKELDEITKMEPENSEALYLQSETYLRLGAEEKAVSSLKECIELSPKYNNRILEKLEATLPISAKPWLINNLLGSIAWKQNRREEALALLSKAQKGSEESIKMLGLELEKYLAESNEDSQLRKLYAENLRLEKRYPEATKEIENLLSKNRDFAPETIAFLTLIIEEEPLQFDANRLLAEILIETGKPDESLTPAVNILLSNNTNSEQVEESADKFYELHQGNKQFLIGYANIKALVNKKDSALNLYRSSLQIEPGSCKEILEGLREHKWPSDLTVKSETLTADCHIAAGEYEWALKSLQNLATKEDADPAEIISRINSLINNQPKTEYFSFALGVHAGNHDFDKADELIKNGASVLPGGDIVELKIELAELADRNGIKNRASKLYSEVLEEVDDKQSILKRIEESLAWVADKRLSEGITQAKGGLIGDEEAISLVNTALDYGRLETALRIVTGNELSQTTRLFLMGRIYLAAERPALAVTLLSSISEAPSLPSDKRTQILYALGAASEILRDYGRAASSFIKILEIHGEYLDARTRAETNYTKFIDSEISNETMILEKTGSL
jgi:predicted Zn-dependent protease